MSDARIEVQSDEVVENLDLFIRELEPGRLSRSFRPDAEKYLRERIRQRFGSDGDDASGRWAPLKDPRPKTQRILRKTRKLYKFITRVRARVEVDGDGFSFLFPGKFPENDRTYWGYFVAQGGSPSHGTPARPIVAATVEDGLKMETLLGAEVMGTTWT